jgi:outer membrane lipoprotein-sorting protein
MKLSTTLLAIAALAALPACTRQAEDSVANQFQNTEAAIENTAAAFESEAENATRAAEAALENSADAMENRIDAIDVVPSNKAGNSQ